MIQESGSQQAPFDAPEKHLPSNVATEADEVFFQTLISGIRSGACIGNAIQQLFGKTNFPQDYIRLALVLYAPGKRRILVSRGGEAVKSRQGRQDLICQPPVVALSGVFFPLRVMLPLRPLRHLGGPGGSGQWPGPGAGAVPPWVFPA